MWRNHSTSHLESHGSMIPRYLPNEEGGGGGGGGDLNRDFLPPHTVHMYE